MPRPRKTPGQLASKNGQRPRLFSIVIHDVDFATAKAKIHTKVDELKTDWYLIAEEPYTHQDGQHLHVFLKYVQPKAKSTVLDWYQKLNLGGRVQVCYGRSDFNLCKKYITAPDKEKLLDENPIIKATKLTLLEKYPEDVGTCITCGVSHYNPPIPLWENTIYRSEKCHRCSAAELRKMWSLQDLPREPPE